MNVEMQIIITAYPIIKELLFKRQDKATIGKDGQNKKAVHIDRNHAA